MRAGHHAQGKRRSSAVAEITEGVNSAIQIEQRDFSAVDRDYCRFPMVRATLRSHLNESGLGHQRQHGVISLLPAPSPTTNKQKLTPNPLAPLHTLRLASTAVHISPQRPMRRSYACEKRLDQTRIVLCRALGVELDAYAAIALAYDERIHIDSILGATNNSGRRLG